MSMRDELRVLADHAEERHPPEVARFLRKIAEAETILSIQSVEAGK